MNSCYNLDSSSVWRKRGPAHITVFLTRWLQWNVNWDTEMIKGRNISYVRTKYLQKKLTYHNAWLQQYPRHQNTSAITYMQLPTLSFDKLLILIFMTFAAIGIAQILCIFTTIFLKCKFFVQFHIQITLIISYQETKLLDFNGEADTKYSEQLRI